MRRRRFQLFFFFFTKNAIFEFNVGQAMLISALTHWGFFWANTSVIYIAEIYDNYECLGMGTIFLVFGFRMLKAGPIGVEDFCLGVSEKNGIYLKRGNFLH